MSRTIGYTLCIEFWLFWVMACCRPPLSQQTDFVSREHSIEGGRNTAGVVANRLFVIANILFFIPYVNYSEGIALLWRTNTIPLGCREICLKRDSKPMSIAARLRKMRESEGFTLDELAAKASISKTYLWELERDAAGEKKPSADVLMRIASALSVTISDLLDLPATHVEGAPVELPSSLQDFKSRM